MSRSAILAGAIGLAVGVAGCGGSSPSSISEASCAATLVWQGRTYVSVKPAKPPEPGRQLGSATVPGCPDQGEPEPPGTVKVRAVVGRAPKRAVMMVNDSRYVYVVR